MAEKAKITLDPAYKIGRIEPRLFGSFLEPIGSWVYGGIWNPKHPAADSDGFRTDILDAVHEFKVPAIRMPGGNFMSGWDWKDSIGPREQRKAHLDLAWKQYEPNIIGHDEYLQWAEKAGVEVLYTLNLGTGTPESAAQCVEYTNHEGGTYWSDLRKKNGHAEPYNVRLWYLGNEMDGPWQINSYEKDPKGYGIKAYETSKMIKYMDSSYETAVCGSSSLGLASYPVWEREVLEQCYPLVDYMSLHYYYWAPEGDYAAFMNGATRFEEFLNTEIAIADYVKAKYRSPKQLKISFDEYGISFNPLEKIHPGRLGNIPLSAYGEFKEDRNRPFRWNDPYNSMDRAPRGSEMLDALGQSSVLMMLLRHADRVKVGCMTGGVRSAIAFDGQHVWKSATYYPFYQLRTYATGNAILPAIECGYFDSKSFNIDDFHYADDNDAIAYVDAAASCDEEKGEAAVFVVNRDWENSTEIEIDVRGFAAQGYHLVDHQEMYSDDLYLHNSFEKTNIAPSVNRDTKMEDGKIIMNAKKLSWNVLRLAK